MARQAKRIGMVTMMLLVVLWAAAANAQPTLILDETAYWRYYVHFGPDRLDSATLKAEGEKVLGKNLPAVEKGVKRYFEAQYVEPDQRKDWYKDDWRDEALYFISQAMNVATDDEQSWRRIYTPPPAANWMAQDFGDGDWFRQRLPLLVGRPDLSIPTQLHGNTSRQTGVRRAYYRTVFEVPDPAQAGDYAISAVFRGGVRVYVNGKEVGRGCLPEGELSPQAVAKAYPPEAYYCLKDERPAKAEANVTSKAGGMSFCGDLPGVFPAAAKDNRGKEPPDPSLAVASTWGIGDVSYYRKAWERLDAVRNRRLGPLPIRKELLRKGSNMLAVELVTADLHPMVGAYRVWQEFYWEHARLFELKLTCSLPAPTAFQRPKGLQVWVEDIHRRGYSADFGPGSAVGTLRFVGGANGTYGGQINIGTSTELADLKVTAGELKSASGAVIPASALKINRMAGHPASEMVTLGQGRNFPEHRREPLCPPAKVALQRFGSGKGRLAEVPREQQLKELGQLQFFDHISEGTHVVPADSCQAVWVNLTVPDSAEAGTYQGRVTVEAGGATMAVPVVAEVFAWRVPDPRDFQTFMALEQSPYGVAKQYQAALWSDEHFRLLEESFRQLARIGNRWLFVPVLKNTEFGNRGDSMIRWTRTADGAWRFDYTILDRYLATATRHMGQPRVISFVVMHGGDSYGDSTKQEIDYLDQASGQTKTLVVNAEVAPEVWREFATALYAHMQGLNLEKAMYWGYGWDTNGDEAMIPLLARYTPTVKWSRGAHGLGAAGADETFQAASRIYGIQLPTRSRMGWAGRYIYLLLPRSGSSILSCNGHSPPFTFRLMVDRALVSGLSGVARLGADYWANSFFEGAPVPNYAVGMPCVQMLWPGPRGAESSARYEVLREGVQETEARIFMEQALSAGLLGEELARRAQQVLFEHNQATLYVSVGTVSEQTHEYSSGWQQRSRRLYETAAQAAAEVGLDVDRQKVELDVPARAVTPVTLKLRNWTNQPRAWTVTSDQPWLTAQARQGQAPRGQQSLTVLVDAAKLPADQVGQCTLTIATEGGKTRKVAFTAAVIRPLSFVVGETWDFLGAPGHASAWQPRRAPDQAVFNVAAGGKETREYALVNRTAAAMSWASESPAPWLTVSPASGTLRPLERTFVKVTAAPPDTTDARHELTLVVRETSGAPDGDAGRLASPPARQDVPVVANVISAYAAPEAPKGTPVKAAGIPNTEIVTLHKSRFYSFGTSDKKRDDYGPRYDADGNIPARIPQITVYNVAGRGFTAFAVKAKINDNAAKKRNPVDDPERWANVELHVDGKLVVQTGLLKGGEEPRLLVARGLKDAKELKVVIRYDTGEARNLISKYSAVLIDPAFYKD